MFNDAMLDLLAMFAVKLTVYPEANKNNLGDNPSAKRDAFAQIIPNPTSDGSKLGKSVEVYEPCVPNYNNSQSASISAALEQLGGGTDIDYEFEWLSHKEYPEGTFVKHHGKLYSTVKGGDFGDYGGLYINYLQGSDKYGKSITQ